MREKSAYKAYTSRNIHELVTQGLLSEEQCHEMQVLGTVFPFKVSNYVIDELIDWKVGSSDPIFRLTFPHRDMLSADQFTQLSGLARGGTPEGALNVAAARIQAQHNPHPAAQIEHNVPIIDGERAMGLQHKYGQTVLFFPSQGQTCHSYCTFCFRWAQFIGDSDMRFAAARSEILVNYVSNHPGVTDILITGGDPLVMSAKVMKRHLDPLLAADLPHVSNIRFGTKSLSYWPQRFVSDPDSGEVLDVFRSIVASGRHCAIMAHLNHPRELSTPIVREAIRRIRGTGAEVRCQSPLIRHINDNSEVWADLWREQVRLGCMPYYMFIARDTGAHEYFRVPFSRALKIFQGAYRTVGGLCRTVRGPAMSADPGKVQIVGTTHLGDEHVFVLQFLQARNPKWVGKPFFAHYDADAAWLSDLRPAGGAEHFFFEKERTYNWLLPWEENENRHHQLTSRGLRRVKPGTRHSHGPWRRVGENHPIGRRG